MIYEFLDADKQYCTALLALDVEGGFDRIDVDLLADLMVARSGLNGLVQWVRHWAGQ